MQLHREMKRNAATTVIVFVLLSVLLISISPSPSLATSTTSATSTSNDFGPFFPLNITQFYKGTWQLADYNNSYGYMNVVTNANSNSNNVEGSDTSAASGETGDNNQSSTPTDLAAIPLLRSTSGGHVLLKMINYETTKSSRYDVVKGELIIRDGIYSSDTDHHFVTRGLYEWRTGHLYIIAVPPQLLLGADNHKFDNNSSSGATQPVLDESNEEDDNGSDGDYIGDGSVANLDIFKDPFEAIWHLKSKAKLRKSLRTYYGLTTGCIFQGHFQFDSISPEVFFEQQREKEERRAVERGELDADDVKKKNDDNNEEEGNEILFSMHGLLWSSNCNVTLNPVDIDSFSYEQYFSKSINYTLMVSLVTFIQILSLVKQMDYTRTQSGVQKMSLAMIGQQAMIDAYLCLILLTNGIVVDPVFNSFATAAFLKFVLFSVFEMAYLLQIWKARRPQGGDPSAMRNELSGLYSRFYGFLLLGIILLYQMSGLFVIYMFILYSFWIPQIVSNVMRDSKKPLCPQYIVVMSISRLAVPFYFFGCPHNFMNFKPNYTVCAYLAIFIFAQAFILLIQHYFGPRFFVPKMFQPPKYNYRRQLTLPDLEEAGEQFECVICMHPVDHHRIAGATTSADMDDSYMVTPCDHVFHARCLLRWMEIKMECPTCRRALPEP